MGTILVAIVVFGALALSIFRMIRARKSGSACAGCPSCDSCSACSSKVSR